MMGESKTSLEIIRRFIELLGSHDGPCEYPAPGHGCRLHLHLFEARRMDAERSLGQIERGLGLK
jgi:hypothetical protein